MAQVLEIEEIDQTGHIRSLTKRRQTVDINSQLDIHINKDSLFKIVDLALIAGGNQAVDSLIGVLKLYRNLIETMNASINSYEQLFSGGGEVDLEALKKQLKTRASAARKILDLFPEDSRLGLAYEEGLSGIRGKGSNERFRVLMRLLSEEIQYLNTDLRELRKEAGFFFQLAAWSATNNGITPIHLDGFDDLPPGEFYEYERNQLYLTKAQLKEMDDLTEYFENTDKGNSFEKLSGVVTGLLEKAVDIEGITAQVIKVKELVKNLETTADAEKKAVADQLQAVELKWGSFKQNVEITIAKYSDRGGVASANSKMAVLTGFSADVQGLQTQLKDLSDFTRTIIPFADTNKLKATTTVITDSLKTLARHFSRSASNIIDYSRDIAQMALYGRKINTEAFKISKKVRKLGIDQVPSTTVLDLRYTGKRTPGDLIVLKAMVWKGTDKEPFKTEIRDFPMMNALAHVHMSVAYTFAKPLEGNENFKGGPLVSVLYKFQSRSIGFRNFLDFGIGLHAASYDFNNDDTPEFAGGAVVSIFKDYLQFGAGFNFNDRKSYWFAGLRIPLLNSSITPGGR